MPSLVVQLICLGKNHTHMAVNLRFLNRLYYGSNEQLNPSCEISFFRQNFRAKIQNLLAIRIFNDGMNEIGEKFSRTVEDFSQWNHGGYEQL